MRPRVLVAAVLAAAALLAALWWRQGPAPAPPASDDPRLTFATPFRNVRPEVRYVGDAVCATCHADIADSYAGHPMGRALAPAADASPIEKYGPAAHEPFTADGIKHGVRRDGARVFHRQWVDGPDGPVAAVEEEVLYAVGSGTRARSYLVSRGGGLFQSPLTWYPEAGRWALSPGFEGKGLHFGRPAAAGCLFCHTTRVEPLAGAANRYAEPTFRGHVIGCERCHGPGELHGRERGERGAAGGVDHTIVNPARLGHALREDVCHQCHVQGEQRVVARGRADFDFRPGLPLPLFLVDFIDARGSAGGHKFVSSAEQVRSSRCYTESRGEKKLGCISCHDPHRHPAPEERPAHYRQRCLKCHTEQSCGLAPQVRRARQADDSCIACHMPRQGSEVNHTAITDHRIHRRPTPRAGEKPATPGPDDLVPFDTARVAAGDHDAARDRGLALIGMLDRMPPEPFRRGYAEKALPLLDKAAERHPSDLPARRARGDALWVLGRHGEALTEYEAVLAKSPDDEWAMGLTGALLLEMGRPRDALPVLERLARLAPGRPHHHSMLARAAYRTGGWAAAARACGEALRLQPFDGPARGLLVQAHLMDGRPEKAAAEYAILRLLTPEARRDDLRRWYEEVGKRVNAAPP